MMVSNNNNEMPRIHILLKQCGIILARKDLSYQGIKHTNLYAPSSILMKYMQNYFKISGEFDKAITTSKF